MSYIDIRKDLTQRLNALSPQLPTGYDNVVFNPPTPPYQLTCLLIGQTVNETFGDGVKKEQGIFQVIVVTKGGEGSYNAIVRAELIRSWFPRALKMPNGVVVGSSPTLRRGYVDNGLYYVPVDIPYFIYTT